MESKPTWDQDADVVIVGYGAAGAAAAISAHDCGAKVLILEKMKGGGGNTVVSMGGFLCPSNVEGAIQYITALYDFSNSEKDETVIRTFAQEAVKNVLWVKSLKAGIEVQLYGHASYPQLPGAETMNKYLVKGRRKGQTAFARNLWEVMTHAVEVSRRIPVKKQTSAERLVTNTDGQVIGVIAEHEGRKIIIRANRGIVLATGGYEYDQSLLQNHVKGFPIYAAGNPGNTGDGVRMAQKVGAALWHMNAVSAGLGIKVPGIKAAFLAVLDAPGHIIVDKAGCRFMNEHGMEAHAGLLAVDHYDTQTLQYPRIPCYAIFDEKTRIRAPISRLIGLGASGCAYSWSKDNMVEVQKGWIIQGQTLHELSEKLNIGSEGLSKTVAQWNQDVKDGHDTLYNRPVTAIPTKRPAYKHNEQKYLSAPIEKPPFYGVALYPCLANTQGGPRRNEAAQVLDSFGHSIPRLYSAGELGSMWGMIYQGAGNISECLAFGRIAGQNAASETPW